jgi:hypothetical protein
MSCSNLKTYNEVRNEKLTQINKFHTQDLLNKFVTFTGPTDNDTVMKQKYKQQLQNLNKKMIDMLSNDVNLLLEQHKELETKTKEVSENDKLLQEIKMNIEKEETSGDARLHNTTQMKELQKTHKLHHNIYFYSNIMVFILIITGIIYLYNN